MRPRAQLLLAIVISLFVGAALGGLGVFLLTGEEQPDPAASADETRRIVALIDKWLDTWNTGDGQTAMELFTDDGRYVGMRLTTGVGGIGPEELKTKLADFYAETPMTVERKGEPWIVKRTDSYHVMVRYRPNWTYDAFELAYVVEEDGEMKLAYVEDLSPLGWFQIAEGLPYQPVVHR